MRKFDLGDAVANCYPQFMAKARKPARRESSISIPNEREINSTRETVPVSPPRVSKRAKKPIANVALDRRKQFTDENANSRRR
jgi:hypothetical protein